MKKSVARIASAWQRRNCAQVGPARRGAGGIGASVRICHSVDGGPQDAGDRSGDDDSDDGVGLPPAGGSTASAKEDREASG